MYAESHFGRLAQLVECLSGDRGSQTEVPVSPGPREGLCSWLTGRVVDYRAVPVTLQEE